MFKFSGIRLLRAQSGAGKLAALAALLLFGSSATLVFLVMANPSDLIPKNLLLAFSLATVLTVAAMTFVARGRASDIFLHPLIGPASYLAYSLLTPLAYIAMTKNGIQYMPSTIYSAAATIVMSLTVLGYTVGVLLALYTQGGHTHIFVPEHRGIHSTPTPSSDPATTVPLNIGRAILGVALAAKIFQWVVEGPVSSRVYGAGQLDYTFSTAIAVAGSSLVAVGCLLTMYGNTIRKARPLLLIDWALVLSIGFISLVILGTRSEMIAPVVLFLWFRLRIGKGFHPGVVMGAIAAIAVVFVVVAQYRTKTLGAVQHPFIENLLADTSSPVYLTATVADLVPRFTGFYWGSTYLEALKFMLPGVISRSLFGPPGGTGTAAYRQLVGFTDPAQGWGFSEPTEAYLNFGFMGVLILAAGIGWLFGRSYLWATSDRRPGRFASYVYPLLISYLPFGLRSDALGQLKSIIYPLAIVGISIWLGRAISKRSRNDPRRWIPESTSTGLRD